jgi:predicted dehydrogenase
MNTIALVGGAHIHTPGFIKRLNARQDLNVKYVWDHDIGRARARADALGARVIDDVSGIWEDETIVAVVNCAETDRHEPLVIDAASAGKHMFVEKPLGLGAADSRAMADAIEDAGVIFQTGYFRRGDPIHLLLKSLVANGSFGTITRFRHSNCHSGSLRGIFDGEYRWMADPAQAGGGGFLDLGTHSLDILLWLMGDVERVTAHVSVATGRYGECDEYGEGLLEFGSGAIGSLAAGWVDVAHPVDVLLSGTEGHAAVVNGQLFLESSQVEGADGKEPWTDLPAASPHSFDVFLDAISGQDTIPLVGAREAAERSAVMEAMYAAARDGAWVAPAPV